MAHDADKEGTALGLGGILMFLLLMLGLVATLGYRHGVVTPTNLHDFAVFFSK